MNLLATEITAFSAAAAKGNILPVCFWLTQAAFDGRWDERTRMVHAVSKIAKRSVLDRACELMPKDAAPRLLRASSVVSDLVAGHELDATLTETVWKDLVAISRETPADKTAHALLSELAWATQTAA
jgi:hypothetical protein